MENISRRTAIKTFLAGGVALATTGIEAAAAAKKKTDVKETLSLIHISEPTRRS